MRSAQDLCPYPDAPMTIEGYVTTIVEALIPPLWLALLELSSPRARHLRDAARRADAAEA